MALYAILIESNTIIPFVKNYQVLMKKENRYIGMGTAENRIQGNLKPL